MRKTCVKHEVNACPTKVERENRNNTSPSIQGSQTCAMDYRGVIWIFWILVFSRSSRTESCLLVILRNLQGIRRSGRKVVVAFEATRKCSSGRRIVF
jgi:hypothetical protein